MNINKDEALRAKDLAESLMKKSDFTAARKLATKAQKMDPDLENISRMMMVCDVHCAAAKENLIGNEMDWYSILQVELNSNDIAIKKQYKKLALLLHPDKNKLPGAESAFKLIGEAQRILLDKDKRSAHDIKRKSWRKPAPAPSYRTQQAPNYQTQQGTVRNVFNDLKPVNRYPQQKAQAQPSATFSYRGQTFLTSCPACRSGYEYIKEFVNKLMTCPACKKPFVAVETGTKFQSVPLAKGSCPATTFSFPQQNKFPSNESNKRPEDPATVFSRKASFPVSGSTADKNNIRKKKRKNTDEFIESSDSESSSDSENGDSIPAQGLGSNGGQQPRRSVRSKREVSYNEILSDDDVEIAGDNEKGSKKNVETEKEEESEDDHHSTENLPNGINQEEKIKEDQAETNLLYDDPDFNDFDKFREQNCFQTGQIWALYDEGEGMPRFYAIIRKVTTPNFTVKYQWLEAKKDEEENETTRNLPVSVGTYKLGGQEKTNSCAPFSHLIQNKTRSTKQFKVFPKKGETWALYKNWNIINTDSDSDSPREYEFVEIMSAYSEQKQLPIRVRFYTKVKGFKCVYRRTTEAESDAFDIQHNEFFRFSHSIPVVRLTGTEGEGVMEGWYEFDPAALQHTGLQKQSEEEEDHQSPPEGEGPSI